jgi:hypothetical protein
LLMCHIPKLVLPTVGSIVDRVFSCNICLLDIYNQGFRRKKSDGSDARPTLLQGTYTWVWRENVTSLNFPQFTIGTSHTEDISMLSYECSYLGVPVQLMYQLDIAVRF